MRLGLQEAEGKSVLGTAWEGFMVLGAGTQLSMLWCWEWCRPRGRCLDTSAEARPPGPSGHVWVQEASIASTQSAQSWETPGVAFPGRASQRGNGRGVILGEPQQRQVGMWTLPMCAPVLPALVNYSHWLSDKGQVWGPQGLSPRKPVLTSPLLTRKWGGEKRMPGRKCHVPQKLVSATAVQTSHSQPLSCMPRPTSAVPDWAVAGGSGASL